MAINEAANRVRVAEEPAVLLIGADTVIEPGSAPGEPTAPVLMVISVPAFNMFWTLRTLILLVVSAVKFELNGVPELLAEFAMVTL